MNYIFILYISSKALAADMFKVFAAFVFYKFMWLSCTLSFVND